jgi:hypothetical protein
MLIIQASPPVLSTSAAKAYGFVRSAIGALFRPHSDAMFWIWNGVPVRIGYNEPFSVLYRDALELVESCLASDEGGGPHSFFEADIATEWNLTWSAGTLRVEATWARAPGGVEKLLQERPRIEMPMADFLAEWKMPFRRVLDAFAATEVVIEDDPDRLERIRAAEAAIPRFGRLYRDDDGSRTRAP